MKTYDRITRTAKRLFAERGYEGLSMRTLSKESGVGLSSIYHFFADKDVLLKAIYEDTNRQLGIARAALPGKLTVRQMMQQLLEFQFEHMEDIVYVLKYYLFFRNQFAVLPTKTLPPKSTLHVEEILQKGVDKGEFWLEPQAISRQAKVISHTINGFLLEYYPEQPKDWERKEIIDDIVYFTMRSLR